MLCPVLRDFFNRCKAGVRARLAQQGVSLADISGLDEIFDVIVQPFSGLETAFKTGEIFQGVSWLGGEYLE